MCAHMLKTIQTNLKTNPEDLPLMCLSLIPSAPLFLGIVIAIKAGIKKNMRENLAHKQSASPKKLARKKRQSNFSKKQKKNSVIHVTTTVSCY